MNTDDVTAQLSAFMAEREWEQFHTPHTLAKSIAIEAGELMELFQWTDDAPAAEVTGELADVLTYCLLLAAKLEVDPLQIVLDKLQVTGEKYPVELARGRSVRHDQL
ncbi:nucleotide pyrophosphohydrolase [Nocardioides sp. Bht2]|uniref:nucleotide pyrophosphohydrolase n=1 Tax=Nocardioides sp. Bht2 TaxID=3392297 RepID=UPI0039B41AF6